MVIFMWNWKMAAITKFSVTLILRDITNASLETGTGIILIIIIYIYILVGHFYSTFCTK